MTAHCAITPTTEIDDLTSDLWDGLISEERFTDCALHAGMTIGEINAILEEIRDEDLS
jgi:hypothetical protein